VLVELISRLAVAGISGKSEEDEMRVVVVG